MIRKWKSTIDFRPFWNDDAISVADKARRAASTIRAIGESAVGKRQGWTDDLEFIAIDFDEADDIESFDHCMSDLYDYADAARIWVATNF